MIAAARRLVFAAGLGGLAGVVDGAARRMSGAESLAAAGWCALVAAAMAIVAGLVAHGLRRAWAADGPALAGARAWIASGSLLLWAAIMVVLGDRFATRFSAGDLAALLWASIGVAVAGGLVLVAEPAARRLSRRPQREPRSAPGRVRALVPVAVAICVAVAVVVALGRGTPPDPRSLGAIAARGLAGRAG